MHSFRFQGTEQNGIFKLTRMKIHPALVKHPAKRGMNQQESGTIREDAINCYKDVKHYQAVDGKIERMWRILSN